MEYSCMAAAKRNFSQFCLWCKSTKMTLICCVLLRGWFQAGRCAGTTRSESQVERSEGLPSYQMRKTGNLCTRMRELLACCWAMPRRLLVCRSGRRPPRTDDQPSVHFASHPCTSCSWGWSVRWVGLGLVLFLRSRGFGGAAGPASRFWPFLPFPLVQQSTVADGGFFSDGFGSCLDSAAFLTGRQRSKAVLFRRFPTTIRTIRTIRLREDSTRRSTQVRTTQSSVAPKKVRAGDLWLGKKSGQHAPCG